MISIRENLWGGGGGYPGTWQTFKKSSIVSKFNYFSRSAQEHPPDDQHRPNPRTYQRQQETSGCQLLQLHHGRDRYRRPADVPQGRLHLVWITFLFFSVLLDSIFYSLDSKRCLVDNVNIFFNMKLFFLILTSPQVFMICST